MLERLLLGLRRDRLDTLADLGSLGVLTPNDMVVDQRGFAYIGDDAYDLAAGIMPGPGSIVPVAPGAEPRIVARDRQFPNGMCVTPETRTLIVAESRGARLSAFRIDADGSLSQRRVFADLPGTEPDGICLDVEGAVWVATSAAGAFLRVRDGSEIVDRVEVPGKSAVACILGGDDRRTLFMCTAQTTLSELIQGKSVGWIESVRVDAPGAGGP
jgi:sugar lactone lactonase YvrE